MRAIVTGSEGGIGRALVERLERAGYEVARLDLLTGFDVTDPAAWDGIEPADVACLNAGVLGGPAEPAALSAADVRRAFTVNVDGVLLGVRRLAGTMGPGGRIVVTASLAGLTAMPDDPIYAATKHAVIGFVRSAAPLLARRGITLDAVCPGIVDSPMLSAHARARLVAAGFPLLEPGEVADAIVAALAVDGGGHAWVVQPGRAPVDYAFPSVPGARTEAGEPAGLPPSLSA